MTQTSMFIPPDPQFFNSNGDPLVGGTAEFYEAGTANPKAVYADGNGAVSLGTTVTLDSVGRAKIWLDGYYKVILKDSLGSTIWTEDNVSSAYSPASSSAPTMSEWQLQDDVLTYIGATSFSVPGDQTLVYTSGRRIKTEVTAGIIYGIITNVAAAGAPIITTVTILWDLAFALDAGLSDAWTGIISPIYSGTPYQVPLGAILDWYKTMTGVPALPYGWEQCDGQTINDPLSPMNGQVMPNLNGAAGGADTFANGKIAPYLRGDAVSGAYSADTVKAHSHSSSVMTAATHNHGPGTLGTDTFAAHTHNVDTYQTNLQDVQGGGADDNIWQDVNNDAETSTAAGAHSHAVTTGAVDGSGPLAVSGNTDLNSAATETIPKTVTAVKIMRVK